MGVWGRFLPRFQVQLSRSVSCLRVHNLNVLKLEAHVFVVAFELLRDE